MIDLKIIRPILNTKDVEIHTSNKDQTAQDVRLFFDASKNGTQNIPFSISPTKEFTHNDPPQVCPYLNESSPVEIIEHMRSQRVTKGLPKNSIN